jgi:glycosyltransferase involved in cell wall biosynthesis
MATIVHMTSVHSPLDPRILEKECRSLAQAGHDVALIAPAERDGFERGVRIVAVPKLPSRLARMLLTTWRVFRAALTLRADAYHFHDPELIPWALVLRLLRYRVIYDVHEDYVSAIEQKRYLSRPLRRLLAHLWDQFERGVAKAFHVVLAERYYAERLPQGRCVLNYPLPDEIGCSSHGAFSKTSRRLLYTGNVSEDRGAIHHASILAGNPGFEVHLVGRCSANLAARMRDTAGAGQNRLVVVGVDSYVPFARIAQCYSQETWLCGLALFPDTPHYIRKELTKFFEYMQAGLPILCSDFPTWRALIEQNGVGICVPPNDPDRIAKALSWLVDHPDEAAKMGERGRKLAQERFTWRSQAIELNRMYEEILMPGRKSRL